VAWELGVRDNDADVGCASVRFAVLAAGEEALFEPRPMLSKAVLRDESWEGPGFVMG
jgi:hypothetical protein